MESAIKETIRKVVVVVVEKKMSYLF